MSPQSARQLVASVRVVRLGVCRVIVGLLGPSKLSREFSSARCPAPDALVSRLVILWTAPVKPVLFDTLQLPLLRELSTTVIRVHRRGSDPFSSSLPTSGVWSNLLSVRPSL